LPRNPEIKVDNEKIARRHVTSFLFQTFFHRYMGEHEIEVGGSTSALFRALGKAADFFFGDPNVCPEFTGFVQWVRGTVIAPDGSVRQQIRSWLPESLRTAPLTLDAWIGHVASRLVDELTEIKATYRPAAAAAPPTTPAAQPQEDDDDDDGEDAEERDALGDEELLEFLFARGLLPSYAFPTDLTSFLVERLDRQPHSRQQKMVIVQKPQQAIDTALSEYAPGRLIVINKETYRSGGVVANVLPTVHDRAAPLFADVTNLIHCDNCSFVRDLDAPRTEDMTCPICQSELQSARMIVPQVFTPEDARAVDEDDRDQDITYATSAQFPVPVGTSDLPELQPQGTNIASVVTLDRKLVTANKGQFSNDIYQGFWICEKCGRATTDEPVPGPHRRPYEIEPSFVPPRPSRQCSGQSHNVFLGHVFSTDLLLARITVALPIATNTADPVVLRALEDGLYSIAEALRLCASRHPQLDLDPAEFGAGFRVVPESSNGQLFLDVYLYDTLSGGAGYAELAGRHLREILDEVLHLLEHCPASCDQSCESCLRHYHNQHLRDRLDRHVGAQLLRYALFGEAPKDPEIDAQVAQLAPLKRLLELDGFTCGSAIPTGNTTGPLVAKRNGVTRIIGIQSGLLDLAAPGGPLKQLIQSGAVQGLVLNEYILRRNLPDEHQLVRDAFTH
jgi:hypothetical protein